MTDIKEYIVRLNELGVKIWVEDDRLRYKVPKAQESLRSSLREELSTRKAAIVKYLAQNRLSNSRLEPIPSLPFDREPTPSPAQQRLWFLTELEGRNNIYNVVSVHRINGRLDEAALRSALAALVQRHDSLRMSFPNVDGEAKVKLNACFDPLSITNLDDLPETDHATAITRWIDARSQEPFDLAEGPLFRAFLLELGEDERILLINIHHIITDGWSFEVLFRELSRLYDAYIRNQPAGLSELSIRYLDYAAWKQDWLNGDALERQIAYWKTKLDGIPELLNLPTDYPRPARMRYRGKRLVRALPPDLTKKIKALARHLGATDFMTLMASFSVLLYRYTGQTDIVVGSPIANRAHPQTEQMIGLLANTLAYRLGVHGAMTFAELLEQGKQTALEAYEHQDVPFEQLVERMNPTRSMSHSPIYQTMFVLQNVPETPFALTGLETKPLLPDHLTARLDLALEMIEDKGCFSCAWEYNTDLFRPETIDTMAEHMQVLLEGVVEHPDLPIAALPLLTDAEKFQVQSWNDTCSEYAKDKTLVDLFEQQASLTPENPAVVFEGRSLSYRDLNRASNKLAGYLKSLGAGHEIPVGVCMDRSPELVIGLLAILKVGGAYVPFDPDYPRARLQFMLEDSRAPVLLSKDFLREKIPPSLATVVWLDKDWDRIAAESPDPIVCPSGPESLAYVIYTSGSTGAPKGVMVEHRSLMNLVNWQIRAFTLSPDDRVTMLASTAFDAAGCELWPTLCAGAALYPVKSDTPLAGGEVFREWLEDKRISIAFIPTALLETLLAERWQPLGLRLVFTGGDTLHSYLPPSCSFKLFNIYGPAENTVATTAADIPKAGLSNCPLIPPIGRPIANTQVHILRFNSNTDDPEYPPLSSPGELCIAGEGLARGYLNRPELTSEKFIEIELEGKRQRIYRTGDCARWLADGNIEFLGRLDRQVNLRGFRIELSEIEISLRNHEAVKDAVVVLNNESSLGHGRLIAYVIGRNEPADDTLPKTLTYWLKERLPVYMVPSQIVLVDQYPLTPNGKIDRNALPVPDFSGESGTYEAPRTETEQCLLKVWQDLLSKPDIGIFDNFFDLGGDSILSIQIVAKARGEGLSLSPRDLFQYQTVAELAQVAKVVAPLKGGLKDPAKAEAPPLAVLDEAELDLLAQRYDNAIVDIYPLSPMQQGMLFHSLQEPDGGIYVEQFHFRLEGELDTGAFEAAWRYLIDRHSVLRTAFCHELGKKPLQVVLKTAELSWQTLDWRDLSQTDKNQQLVELLRAERRQGFDFSRPPLMRMQLIQETDATFRLIWNHHHMLLDGWCFPILISELFEAYDAIRADQKPILPEIPPYRDYIAWLTRQDNATAKAYWQDYLAGIRMPTPLPARERHSERGEIKEATLCLDLGLSEELRQFSRYHRLTLNTLVQGAWAELLNRYSGQEVNTVVFGVTTSGRQAPIPGIDRMVGLFINTLPLRVNLGNRTILDVLQTIQQDMQQSSWYAYTALSDIQRWSELPGGIPLFETLVVFENYPIEEKLKRDDFTGSVKISDFDGIEHTNYPVTLAVLPQSELVFRLAFDSTRFSPKRMETLLTHLSRLLQGMVAHPRRVWSQIPLTSEAEERRFRVWNQTLGDYPRAQTVVDLFQAQSEETPDNIAIALVEDKALSYRSLNEKANQLARYLTSLGVRRETLVSVCMDRSPDLIIALLAILKAGGAYVPLDPDYPTARLQFMLEDSGVPVLISKDFLREKIPPSLATIVWLDKDWDRIAQESPEPVICPSGPENLAYVIYTSGSTGVPKGVMVEHRSLVNLVNWHNKAFAISPQDRATMLASPAFDASGWELWPYLCAGATVVPVQSDTLFAGGEIFKQWLAEKQISVAFIPTAMLEALIAEPWRKTSLRLVLTGGDTLQSYLPASCPFKLYNNYGPTESTVVATSSEVSRASQPDCPIIPTIGRPIANTRIYILSHSTTNRDRPHQVPAGIPGELCIAGNGLARGYLNKPELTAEKFVEIEIEGERQRIYRTGDCARWLDDGSIEFLGRLDRQVSLRGFRIELSEIETSLRDHHAVKDAVVILLKNGDGTTGHGRLIAYVTGPNGPEEGLPKALICWLKDRLPAHMIPAQIVLMDRFPLTPNGKIDRNALPVPGLSVESGTSVAPRTEMERRLVMVWQEVLKNPQIGIFDNFFDLGGDSILSIQIVARAQSQGLRLNPRDLFRHQTVADLALVARADAPQGAAPLHVTEELLSPAAPPHADLDRLAQRYGDAIAEIYPLSPMQEGMLFHSLHTPEGAIYLEQFHGVVKGQLNLKAFTSAWQYLVLRHPILRTAFCHDMGRPMQVVLQSADLPLQVLNWRAVPEEEKGFRLQDLLLSERSRGFDLGQAPLMRLQLIEEGHDSYRLVVHHHHLLLDGWCLPILFGELFEAYAAMAAGQLPQLQPAPPYRDYIDWLGRQSPETAKAHWENYLSGFSAPTPLPTGQGRHAARDAREHTALTLFIDADLSRRVRRFGRKHRLTLSTLFQGAWAALLSRYSGEDDVVFGVTTSGRQVPIPGIDRMVGLFINTLPLRVRTGDRPVINVLRQIQEDQQQNDDYVYSALSDVQKWSQVSKGTPLFETILVFENYPVDEKLKEKRDAEFPEISDFTGIEYTNYPISIAVMPSEAFYLRLTYDSGRFDAASMERLADHLSRLLEGMITRPDLHWSELPLLSETEKWQLQAWSQTGINRAETSSFAGLTVVDVFQARADKYPDLTAVDFEGETLTYQDLNWASNRLAHYLISKGVGPEVLVGICVERSLEMIVGLWGILKAGAAFVPLDPDYPRARLQFMLEDAKVPLLLTLSHLRERLPTVAAEVIELDRERDMMATHSPKNPPRQSGPSDLAYTIYTSGSTGNPKGVMVEHAALLNHMRWMERTFGLTAEDRFLQKTPFSFDPSVWELFAPLLAGATMVMAKPGGHQDPEYLLRIIADRKISVLRVVPSLLKMMLDTPEFQRATPLRYLFCGGESLSPDLIRTFHRLHPQTQMINLYGPTEATIVASFWNCDPDCRETSIGRPIDNAQIYILDRHQAPLPPGVPGELCIAGKCLARGYLNREELTVERFVDAEVFGEVQRLYRTGDLARWGPSGNLEYLGRMDHQVKLRGMRIELTEIEVAICRHAAVKDAVVILHETVSPSLAAYVTLAANLTDVAEKLKAWLKECLPAYMVPSSFKVLEEFPLTPNGKINRKGLPPPEAAPLSGGYAAPRTNTERHLLQVWQQVLKQPAIGIFDNFFEQGGDSILSIQIVARVRDYGLELSSRDLFQYQTIAELAGQVRPIDHFKTAEQGIILGATPLSPIQQRFFSYHPEGPRRFNHAVLLSLPADVDESALGNALAAILTHHDALRLRFRRDRGRWSGCFDRFSREDVPFHLEDLSHLQSKTAIDQALADKCDFWQSSFDLEKGPLVRMVLFRFGQQSRLLWCIHHLLVDGVSWRILLEDLVNAYRQAAGGKTIRLPEKTASYKAWTARLIEWKESPDFNEAAEYWRSLPEAAPLPVDYPDGSNKHTDAKDCIIRLTEEMTRRLLTEAPAAYRTRINDLLLTALMLTLEEWTGRSEGLIDLESHGRNDNLFEDLDLFRTVGWFTAIHPVALRLPAKPDPGSALKYVKEQLRQVPQGGLGYGVARWLLNEYLPAGQILFNYLGQFDRRLPGEEWQLATENSGQSVDLEGERPYSIEINGQVIDGSLSLTWTYSGRQYRAETAKQLANRYRCHLEGLVEHCATEQGFTPSDFPLAGLTQERLDLLTQRYADQIVDIYPLVPMQQGMLFHTIEAPDEGVYFVQRHFLIKGPLDALAFRQAWQHLIERHTILRTAVNHDTGSPLQLVMKTAILPWQDLDWRDLPRIDQQRHRLDELLASEQSAGFDLGRAPLMRVQLIREGDTAWRLVWHHHHLLMDGWCLPILFGELFDTYSAISKARPPRLPQAPPYQAYIAWLNRQDREKAKAHWRTYLQGFATPTPLPLGRNSRGKADFRDLKLSLPADISQKLAQFSRNHRLTLNTLILGAWSALLSRYTGEGEVLFGATTSGRQAPVASIDRMIGLFINTLPLRVKVADAPMLDVLQNIQQGQQLNEQYAYTALTDIQRETKIPGGIPLFETIVVFENYPVEDNLKSRGPTASLEIEDVGGKELSNYPMTLVVIPQDVIQLKLTYDGNRCDEDGMEGLLAHFARLLEGILARPNLPCHKLPLLSEAEQEQQLSWNLAASDAHGERTIVEWFEQQVDRNPDRTAVVFEDKSLSYEALNMKANQLARLLKITGVGPESLVGICVDRSLEMIVGLLGILKAGGAYIPLDPYYPTSRLAFMLEDASVPLVLSQEHLLERMPVLKGVEIICLNGLDNHLTGYSSENLPQQCHPENLAYVIYTSGSTGKPKGCMVTHANVTRLFSTTERQFYFNKDDVWTLFHSYAFDFSIWEIFGALLYGGRLEVLSFFVTRTPEAFYRLLIDRKVTILNQTPSSFTQLNLVDSRPDELSLRTIILGGEALDFKILNDWFARHDDRRPQLFNMYGITETTVHVTSYPLTAKDGRDKSLIGRPISDLEAWVLDAHRQPVPVGVPGELHVAGAGLARGYLNRSELTAERFINISIFGKSKRLYKTGDLVRRRSDGSLEYIGRVDHQIKLRGFRIELAEIEAALKQHVAVYEAAAVLRKTDDTPRLAAYVTLRSADSPGLSDPPGLLREWLKTLLPDYMVPGNIIVLDRMPLTPNGKLDQQALPDQDRSASARTYEAPRTDTERRLLNVWRKVLKQPHIGIFDNFFEQGGDSILSIQIVAMARTVGIELTPRELFQHQTVAELARAVRLAVAKRTAEQRPVIGEMPLTPIQRRFFATGRHQPAHFNQAILLKVPVTIDETALQQAADKILTHHDALRLRFHQRSDEWVASHDGAPPLQLHTEDLTHLGSWEEQNRALVERADSWQLSLNLSDGPLVRLVLFRLGDQSRLLWLIHHLLVDGVSWRILLEDLYSAYQQVVDGKTAHLPDKTDSYKAWAELLQSWKDSAMRNGVENAYWQNLPEASAIPVDHPEGSNRVIDCRQYTISLTPACTQRLLTEASSAYRTRINDLLLTALMLTLREWTGRQSALIDLESHGRADLDGDMDISRTVGWFTSLYPQHLRLPLDPDIGSALKAVKEQLRQVPNEGVGYGIRRWIDQDDLPRGQILFNYLGQFDQVLSDAPWQFAPEECGRPTGLEEERDYLIEINGRVIAGCLSLTWNYSCRHYEKETIEALGSGFQQNLERLIEHCTQSTGYTPSDFPLTALDQEQLDLLTLRYASNIADIYSLSPMQQGLLFHSLRDPLAGMYFEQFHCRLKGNLDAIALHKAWQYLVDRHTILRSAFCHDLNSPLQLVMKTAKLPWQYLDWRDFSEEVSAQRLDALLAAERAKGFELNKAPLMRVQLIQEGEDSWRMVWNHHHLLLDGWSMPILFSDLFLAYTAIIQGRPPRLPSARPYQAYIAWLGQQDLGPAQAYWQAYLAGFSAPTPLPHGQPAEGSEGHSKLTLSLGSDLTRKLRHFSKSHRLTLNTLLQGGWAALLSRYSGEDEVVFGVTTSGRQIPILGIDQMVGLFINTVPLRIDLSSGPVLEVLHRLQRDHQQSDQYAYAALAEIQNLSEVPNGIPLFETILVYENYPVKEKPAHSESLDILDFKGIEHTNYPLALAVTPGEALTLNLTYDTRRFEEGEMKTLLARLSRLMEGMIDYPGEAWSRLPLLTEAERRDLETWNQTETDIPRDLTILDLFQNQAEQTPDRTAVVFEEQTLSYRALSEKADCLAHNLLAKGFGHGALVGVFLERSIDMVVALLGTLKAGCAYVPMDPNYPRARLQFMLEDAKAPVLLTLSRLKERLPPTAAAVEVIELDRAWDSTAVHSPRDLARQSGPDDPAYVIYTSGSTGQPKGVVIEHGALLNHMLWMVRTFSFRPDDKVLQKTPFSFDASVWEFYAPLLTGGTLVMARPEGHKDPRYLFDTILEQGITVLQLVPIGLKMMLEDPDIPAAVPLRFLFCGGEHLSRDLVQTCHQKFPGIRLFNLYGPTEATIDATCFACEPDRADVTIGSPIANTRVYILDRNLLPLPPGIPGELCIAGQGLAREYLNREELTAESFVDAEIFGKVQRLYKTGDLARWGRDGNLEFLGRLDHQVKFRGYRIELQEIEATLKRHDAVEEAVVTPCHVGGTPRLVAHVTIWRHRLPGVASDRLPGILRNWVGDRLPDYMVPSDVAVLDKFPLTPSGKVDRSALPAPTPLTSHAQFLAPRNRKEMILSQIWEEVLMLPHIGIKDNFFELGGHSLTAVRLASQIKLAFKRELPLSTLFKTPTIEALARSLELPPPSGKDAVPWSPLVALNEDGKNPPLFFVHPAGGTIFCYYEMARHLGKDQPIFGLQAIGIEANQEPLNQMGQMAETYVEAIRSVQAHGPYRLAGWSFGGQAAFEMACRLQAKGESVSLLALLDSSMRVPGEAPLIPGDDAQLMYDLLTEEGVSLSLETLRKLPLDEQLLYVKEQGRQVDYFPADIDLEELRRLFNVYKANLAASLSYAPQHQFSGKVILFKAMEQAPTMRDRPDDLGWGTFASQGVEVIPVPGHHHNIAQSPHVENLAEILRVFLENSLDVGPRNNT